MTALFGRLTRRAEFLRTAAGRRSAMPGLVLQVRRRDDGGSDPAAVRVGYTVTRKVGNAVQRNRVRRRLRAVARLIMPDGGVPGHDYVVVGRLETLVRPFADLTRDLRAALGKLAGGSGHLGNARPS
ncbi:MAG: ribonuclease P protein component [Alphaproteobacteria bacterium]|nr:ribonuclease P protein component [Alphaproteobacteria bacterium]